MATKKYFEKILVPVDGSLSCLRAKEVAALIAKKFKSKVKVIHVISHDFMHPELKANYQLPPLVLDQLEKSYLETGKKIIKIAEELFKEEGIEVQAQLVKHEDPAEKVLRLIEEEAFDLVVMGNRSEDQAERFSLGSITEKVSMYAKCPVLIVKGKTKIMKILSATDASEQANKALEYAVQLAQNFEAKITLLHVEEKRLYQLEQKAISHVCESILRDAENKVEGIDIDKRLEFGSPAETIIKVAKEEGHDLIILGSRGLNTAKRFLLGSVSADVSMHARRSVLIIR